MIKNYAKNSTELYLSKPILYRHSRVVHLAGILQSKNSQSGNPFFKKLNL